MPTIALLGCSARKLGHPAPVRALYQGDLFRKGLAWAEATCDRVMVLSALHGLVALDQVVAPYDLTLNDLSAAERRAWAERIRLPDGDPVYLCGRNYWQHLRPGATPLAGLGIGQQLGWLKAHCAEIGVPAVVGKPQHGD